MTTNKNGLTANLITSYEDKLLFSISHKGSVKLEATREILAEIDLWKTGDLLVLIPAQFARQLHAGDIVAFPCRRANPDADMEVVERPEQINWVSFLRVLNSHPDENKAILIEDCNTCFNYDEMCRGGYYRVTVLTN